MGHSVKRSNKTAIKWYRKAARKRHRDAQYRVGVLYYKQKQYSKARYWLAKRAKAGHSDAQYYYANTFRYALGTKEKTSIARRWYTKAAKQGHAKAQHELAMQYQKGIGAKKNTKLAKQWFDRAVQKKPKKNKNTHSVKITKTTQNKAPKEPNKATIDKALLGDREQQYKLGMQYLLGYKIEGDKTKAIHWLSKAATQDHPRALYQMANQYQKGGVLEKNLSLAIQYFTAAAKQNVLSAKTALKHLTDTKPSLPTMTETSENN